MRKINDSKGNLLCIVYKDEDWVEGLNFITDNSLFVQVGSWWYQKGKNLAKHKHNIVSRESLIFLIFIIIIYLYLKELDL